MLYPAITGLKPGTLAKSGKVKSMDSATFLMSPAGAARGRTFLAVQTPRFCDRTRNRRRQIFLIVFSLKTRDTRACSS